jgi:NADPH-dependent 2,4-dienoyl-CoA reductase/sulfur reductase-like enzyme/nitrite reductase/ring-hydroxylating ferredoxin subunit
MSEPTEKTRDFGTGVPMAALPAGQLVCGSFKGRPVLLVNNQGRYCALSATCTHMGAPLAEGLVVENRVHCPWHHARFSLETGEAVAAPAFEPLTRFGTTVRDGRVFVTDALEAFNAPAPVPSTPRVVIIGGGAAGYACAEMLARSGYGSAVTVVSDDTDPPYDRTVCSKQYLIGMKSRDDSLLPPIDVTSPELVTRTRRHVRSLDTRAKSVQLDSGERLDFDILVLATGAEPRRPKLAGLDRANVYLLRTLSDADSLIHASRKGKKVAIVGASFIGLEVAASLQQCNLEIHVVAPDEVPLAKIVGAEVGNMIRQVHEEKGVRFHLGRTVSSFDGRLLKLDDESTIEVDFVVLGTGVIPRTDLARAAGLACASDEEGGGIEVNERLETSVPGIYAVGDVARYPDPHSGGERIRVEHWVHAQRQGQYVARALISKMAGYSDVPFFWSAHFDTGLRYLGHVSAIAHEKTEGSIEDRSFTIGFTGNKKGEKAVTTCNQDLSALQVEAAWDRPNS